MADEVNVNLRLLEIVMAERGRLRSEGFTGDTTRQALDAVFVAADIMGKDNRPIFRAPKTVRETKLAHERIEEIVSGFGDMVRLHQDGDAAPSYAPFIQSPAAEASSVTVPTKGLTWDILCDIFTPIIGMNRSSTALSEAKARTLAKAPKLLTVEQFRDVTKAVRDACDRVVGYCQCTGVDDSASLKSEIEGIIARSPQ